jgi:hypothetical protein
MMAESHGGPVALLQGEPQAADLETAARITARYGQGRDADRVTVRVRRSDGAEQVLDVAPLARHEIPERWHV